MTERAIALLLALSFAGAGYAQDNAGAVYQARYLVSGFLLRASNVCGGDWQRTVRASIDIITTPEMKVITQSYPESTKQWMADGAANFNNGVMTSGVAPTCALALQDRQKAEQILTGKIPKPNRSPSTPRAKATDVADNSIQIPLEVSGGTFVVPATINGEIKLNFTIDSGAADVSIPADVVSTLIRTGSLKASDFTGQQNYQLADGSIVPSATFIIRSLKVGDRILTDVKGNVASEKAGLLLGQSFLSRFKNWSIDNQKQVLILN